MCALSLAAEPSDDAALAALATENRGNNTLAQTLYQQTYDLVPDVNCSAARFALQRRAATKPPALR
ncbi:hypothetical protein RLEG3_05525 (plasmid) [Rhizobium leguminosarum bv. trifolii WSM1689]|nr:hypothetical protein RLEG3_05525 [Rhizobium leguminosarum bv. trifolii WSM1689]